MPAVLVGYSPATRGKGGIVQSTGQGILDRAMRVIRLDLPAYREIELDKKATTEAAIVVGVVAVASAIGSLRGDDWLLNAIIGLVGTFLSWVIFAASTYFFGRYVFGVSANEVSVEGLMRTQGYAHAPGILGVFGFIPALGWIAVLVGGIWSLVTAIGAIRESLNVGTGKAILVGLIASIAAAIVIGIIRLIFNLDFGAGSI